MYRKSIITLILGNEKKAKKEFRKHATSMKDNGKYHYPPIIIAANLGHNKMIKFYLDNNVCVNTCDKLFDESQKTAFIAAVKNGHYTTTKIILNHCCYLVNEYGIEDNGESAIQNIKLMKKKYRHDLTRLKKYDKIMNLITWTKLEREKLRKMYKINNPNNLIFNHSKLLTLVYLSKNELSHMHDIIIYHIIPLLFI